MSRIVKTIGSISAAAIFVMVTALSANAQNEEKRYDLKVTTKVTPDGKKEATIVVTAKMPVYHNNMSYPWKITLHSGPGVTPDTKFKKGDAKPFSEKEVKFVIKTDNSATEKVKATLKMSQCDHKQCWTAQEKLEW